MEVIRIEDALNPVEPERDRPKRSSLWPVVLVCSIGLMLGLYRSRTDFYYLIRGRTTEADVHHKAYVRQGEGRSSREMIRVEYHFRDGDITRAERDEVDVTWEIEAPGKIAVEYIPGRRGASRLKGNTAVFSHGLTIVCGLGLAGAAFVRYRELRQGEAPAQRELEG